ncbi:unnamed protein product [Paramecium sonneborni]|uniref:Transmembrane protein n=1 Tax=Paramecium sonneborni TaxID=65129 RepID=A0A8S1NY33_9CILI|nr:unnamed protein product [Paramecium sonneborni]
MNLKLSFALVITMMPTLLDSQYLMELDEVYQYYQIPISVNINNYQIDEVGIYGIWSRYIPLSTIKQIGAFGIIDSNCYHLNSAIEKYTQRINFVYFDCLNSETMTVTKHLQFIDDQRQLHKLQIKIDPFQYEYYWYFLVITFAPHQKRFKYYIFQNNNIVENQSFDIKFPYQDENLLLIFGGGLEITETQQISIDQTSKLPYFPGQLNILSFAKTSLTENQLFFQIEIFTTWECVCVCNLNQNQILPDIDIKWMDQKLFASTNINCDSFAFHAWIKITECYSDQEEFLYQLMKLSSNFENSVMKNENLASFQLFYKVSNLNNQIIITTYNYSFPYYNMDFIKNSFLIQKSFDLPKVTLWHFVYVIQLQNTIKFSIMIQDGIFKTQSESIFQVNQFHMVQFKLQYGNIMQLSSNYLSVSLRNIKFLNCIYDEQYYPNQICHYSCLECDGPTQNDCLSCSKESKRIYLAKYKICLCPYYMIDKEVCQDKENYGLFLQLQQHENQQCNYGYFNYNQNCQKCPSIINDQVLTCLECLEQPQNWLNDPYCETNLFLNRDGSPSKIFKDSSKTYYILYENDLKPQNFFTTDFNIKTKEIFTDYLVTNQFFETNYKFVQFDSMPIYSQCNLYFCVQCGYELTRIICIRCFKTSILKDGFCIKKQTGQQKFNQCLASFYKTSENICKLCQIDNCIYCFEYLINDLTKCTLYQGFQAFQIDEYHRVGCALCKNGFIFDFIKGKCIYEQPNIKNCLRAYNDLTGKQICTLSLVDDFSISPEIQNCNKYITNCKQCVQTPQNIIKCIICEDGYSSSITTGHCSICQIENAKFCIEGLLKEQDSWIHLIQSFLMQFLPDKYFYSIPSLTVIPLPVKCIDGYEVNQFLCKKSCNNNCEVCQKNIIPSNGFTCSMCKMNYFMENLRSIDQEQCLECPQLCQVCQKRQIQEIQKINPIFVINDNSYIFTMKCIKFFPYHNVVIDQFSQTAKYCFEQNCNNYLKYQVENNCNSILSLFNTMKHEQFQNKLDFQYLNQIGLSIFQLILPYNLNCIYDGDKFIAINLYNLIKMKIFSLTLVELMIKGQNIPSKIFSNIITFDFDSIQIVEVSFYMNELFSFQFFNQNKSINFNLQNSSITASENSRTQISIKAQLYDQFKIQNLTLYNMNIRNSQIFEIHSKEITLIDTIIIQNCQFDNTTLFSLLNNFKTVIQNFKIIECQFYNSSIFNFTQNSDFYLQPQIKGIFIQNSYFYNSQIIITTPYVDFQIIQSVIKNSQFNSSQFLIFSNNLNIVDLIIEQNTFFNSQLITLISFVQNISNSISIFDVNILQNSFSNTKVFLSEQQQSYNFKNILMTNLKFQENFQIQLTHSKTYIFSISCFKLILNNIIISSSKNMNYFTLFNVYQIDIENLQYYNIFQQHKIKLSLKCLEEANFNSHLLNIQGFTHLTINNLVVQNQFNSDSSIISIYSNFINQDEEQETIQINNLQFIGNLIQKIKLGQILSLIIIYSEKNQNISIKNIKFEENALHQYLDDSSQNIASLILIHSQLSYLVIQNFYCKNNILTNSSNTFINLFLNEIFISDLVVENHNQIQQNIWSKVFQIQLGQNLSQDQLNQIINKLLIIQNIGGALSIIAQQCQLINSSFKNLLAYKSLIINLKTQGKGIVNFNNLKMMHIYNINFNSTENDGSITIFSQYSLLNFQFIDIVFFDVLNNLGSSILALTPSSKQNKILIKNINIQNCFSLLNLFLKAHFQINYYKENQVSIINQTIIQNKTSFIEYLKKLGSLNHFLTQNILQDNSIINLQGCKLSVNQFVIEGVILSSIFKIEDSYQLKINNIYVYEVLLLFQINLFHIVQKSISTIFSFQNIIFQSITNVNLINIDFKSQFINVELQQLNCDLENIIYSFYEEESNFIEFYNRLIKLNNSNNFILFYQSQSNNNRIQLSQISILNNDLQNFLSGIIYFNLINYSEINIKDVLCFKNIVNLYGCIFVESISQSKSIVKILNSLFLKNNGGTGTAILIYNTIFLLSNSKIINNTAKYGGGGIYIQQQNHQIQLNQTLIINNRANQAGGIFINTINSTTFVKSLVWFNNASLPPNNLQELPTLLELQINWQQMKSILIIKEDLQAQTLLMYPYKVIDQGKLIQAKLLMLPSNQIIKDYQIFNTQVQSFQKYIEQMQIIFKNSMNEQLINFINSTCEIRQQLGQNDYFQTIKSEEIKFDQNINSFDLSTKSFSFDPFMSDKFQEQILIGCKVDNSMQELYYRIQIKTFKCQLGEFYIENNCQLCQFKQGYYSVTYNATKCSIFDSKKFESITSNQIQLKIGYWRPNYFSDEIEFCFKFKESCLGGWMVGDQICYQGHIGGLCEECDRFNIRGDGLFFKNQYNSLCHLCENDYSRFHFFILASLWVIFSTLLTLYSIDKSNRLFSVLKIRQRFARIIFKLSQDHASILLKLFLNYIWIFSVIFSFNIKFSFSFSFIDQTSNPSFFMANSLDCYLSEFQEIQLIYLRIITMFLLLACLFFAIYIGFKLYSLIKHKKFQTSILSITALYLFVSNYPAFIKQFFSLLAKRQISQIDYIQGDVSLRYGTKTHFNWIISLILPGLTCIGIILPFSLLVLLYIKRDQLENINLRKHICYLFNEYDRHSYYWEWIKLGEKTVIIIILTYFETDIYLKSSLLGICLLFYQIYSQKQRPYIIQNLNNLDVQTGQICSIAIFFAVIKYICEQQNNIVISLILQGILVLFFILLSYPFLKNIVQFYHKKYFRLFLINLTKLMKLMKISFLAKFLNIKIHKLNQKEQKLQENFAKLRNHLISISKFQLEQQKSLTALISSQSLFRNKLQSFDYNHQKNIINVNN